MKKTAEPKPVSGFELHRKARSLRQLLH